MLLIKAYWSILSDRRGQAIFVIVLTGSAGLLEGLALLALIPVLQSGLSASAQRQDYGYIGRFMELFAIPVDHVLTTAIVIFASLAIMAVLIRLGADVLTLRLKIKIEESIRCRTGEALLDMTWARYLSMKVGDIGKAMIIEGQQIGVGTQLILIGLGSVLVAIAYIGVAFLVSMPMTLVTLAFGTLGGVAYYWAGKAAQTHADKLSRIAGEIGHQIEEIFGNLKFVRATGLAKLADQKARAVYRRYARTYFLSQVFEPIMRFGYELGAIVFIAMFLSVALLAYKQPVASTLVFLAVFYRLVPRLLAIQQSFFQARVYLSWYWTWKERLHSAIVHKEMPDGTIALRDFSSLETRNLRFRYPMTSKNALTDVNIHVEQGQCLAIVGASGSGKSTLIDLVTGLLRPTAGRVLVNGVDLREVKLDFWRKGIGLVIQDAPVFHTSILENIAWGEENPSREKAELVARMAHAWEFIEGLPDGLNSIVGEKGGRLSGGQKQRIALARALYRDPWLLILDEATSALDGQSEATIQAALKEIKGSCSMLIVAHRLKTVQIADAIAVLDHGSIIEQGTWADLVDGGDGVFRRMAALQGLLQESV